MKRILIVLAVLGLFASCQSNEDDNHKELTITGDATEIGYTSAKITGFVNLPFELGDAVFGVVCSEDPSPSNENGIMVEATETDANNMYSVILKGLSSNTKFYYASFVRNGRVYQYGKVKSFKTLEVNAELKTEPATGIEVFAATLNGSLKVESNADPNMDLYFLYGKDNTTEGLKVNGQRCVASLGDDGKFSSKIGLHQNTLYYYLACARVFDKEYVGEVLSFHTQEVELKTESATNVGIIVAQLNGSLNVENIMELNKSFCAWFLYGTDSTVEGLKENGQRCNAGLGNDDSFFSNITGLNYNTTYYYVFCASMFDEKYMEYVGGVESFQTAGIELANGAVDMGLSVKWAGCNLGATKPEEYGDYYAWGETEPYYSSLAPLTWKNGKENGYNWASYKWCNGSSSSITKYNTVDEKVELDLQDDAAHANWGGKWHMPTADEWSELIENCTCAQVKANSVNGLLVVSNKNGNILFFPEAGSLSKLYTNNYVFGYYWSSSLSTGINAAQCVAFGNSDDVFFGSLNRCYGQSIRPVTD